MNTNEQGFPTGTFLHHPEESAIHCDRFVSVFIRVHPWLKCGFKLRAFILVLLCFGMGCDAAESEAATNNIPVVTTNQCRQFTLQDQFGTNHQFNFPQTKPVVLTVADKQGSGGIEGWAHPLAERFGDRIQIAGLADVSSVPAPLRGLVRSKFKKAIQHPVMLDWKGDVTRGFNYTKGKPNVYLIAPDGVVLHHVAGDAEESAVWELGDRVEKALPPAAQSPSENSPDAESSSFSSSSSSSKTLKNRGRGGER